MKKMYVGILLLCLFGFISNVSAETFYTNENGLNFTQFQYETMINILGVDNVAVMTLDEYDRFNVGLMTEENTTVNSTEENYYDGNYSIMPLGTYWETQSKKLSIASVCSGNTCAVTLTATWKADPAVRSYDVIGTRLVGTTYANSTNSITLRIDNSAISPCATKTASNGKAGVVKLTSGDVKYITQSVVVNKGGTVFGSYQHAKASVTKAKASNFTFGGSGLGSVFVYPSSVSIKYDGMTGVSVVAN